MVQTTLSRTPKIVIALEIAATLLFGYYIFSCEDFLAHDAIEWRSSAITCYFPALIVLFGAFLHPLRTNISYEQSYKAAKAIIVATSGFAFYFKPHSLSIEDLSWWLFFLPYALFTISLVWNILRGDAVLEASSSSISKRIQLRKVLYFVGGLSSVFLIPLSWFITGYYLFRGLDIALVLGWAFLVSICCLDLGRRRRSSANSFFAYMIVLSGIGLTVMFGLLCRDEITALIAGLIILGGVGFASGKWLLGAPLEHA